MAKHFRSYPMIITFRTPNGNTWSETHSSTLLSIFKKDTTVMEIRNKTTDEIIFKRKDK